MIPLFRKKRAPSSVLGLSLNGSQIEGVLIRRSNGSLQIQKTFSASLALNPLSADPELMGREIRNHLVNAGIRERHCVVCVPLNWALVLQVKIPDLPEADVASYLELEAERGFPYALDTLVVSTSLCRAPGEPAYATLAAIPRNHLAQLENALKAARLRPLNFSLSPVVLQQPSTSPTEGILNLVLRSTQADLQVTWGGGIAALRSLDAGAQSEQGEKVISVETIAPELRITLGQLPPEIRTAVKTARLFGRGDFARELARQVAPSLKALGLATEIVQRYAPDEFGKRLPSEIEVSPATSAAALTVIGRALPLEFMLPRTNAWQQFSGRFSSKKLVWAGATAGALVLLGSGLFAYQQWQLSKLQTRWSAMEPTVRDLQELQQQIKKFRPWFDQSLTTLRILKTLTEAFPTEGAVTAKTLEIRDNSSITCTGVTRDSQALLAVYDKLRASKQVASLKMDQVRGKPPMQFTFNFRWLEGGARED